MKVLKRGEIVELDNIEKRGWCCDCDTDKFCINAKYDELYITCNKCSEEIWIFA